MPRGALVLAVLGMLAAGCGSSGGDGGDGGLPLEGTAWVLQSRDDGGTTVPVPEGVVVTARFIDGRVAGRGGCNRYSAGYTLDGDSLSIGPVASTLMACPEPAASLETAFLSALGRTATYATDSTTLTLADSSGSTILTFREGKDVPLVATTWTATGINNGSGGVVSLVANSQVTAVFGEDGTVSGSGGCNTYMGEYRVDGSAMSIGPLASTRMACAEAEGVDAQEVQFLAAMERTSQHRIDGTTLELRDDAGALQVSFQVSEG